MMKVIFLLPVLLSSIGVLSAPAPLPAPEPYIVTQYVQESAAYTDDGYTYPFTTISPTIKTITSSVKPTNIPTNGLRTITDSTSYAEVTIIEILLPPGTVPKITSNLNDPSGTVDDFYAQPTQYVVPVTYTPLASCVSRYSSQTWALTTNIPISLPYPVQGAITPLSLLASTSTYTNYNARLSLITAQYAILNPTDIPTATLSSLQSLYEPWGISSCYTPTTSCHVQTATSSGQIFKEETCYDTFGWNNSERYYPNDINSPYPDGYHDPYGHYYYIIVFIVVPVLSWLIFFFLLGLIESYLSFKGLMLGKQRKRGVPYMWCCVNCFTLCCVGPTYKAKSAEEQVILRERWNGYKKREKLKLWWSWGLKWRYPDVLGEAPEIDRRALRERCL